MKQGYTNERNHQILIALLKVHGVRYIVASPGTTNSVFVGSVQGDPYFKVFSCVDERSAAYMACGIAFETNEPVVISCTGATAARNYMSAATEAFYSKLPILILTSSQSSNKVGHLIAQVTDRSAPPKDVCRLSVTIPTITNRDDEWETEVKCNNAILELRRNGGGPVHLNIITTYRYCESTALTAAELPAVRTIRRYTYGYDFPSLPDGNICVFIGHHGKWTERQTKILEQFCQNHNAVVLVDHTSNYHGNYRVPFALSINQSAINKANIPAYTCDLIIHIGEVSAEEGAMRMIRSKETWRVSEDGEIRDTFRNLTNVFEMTEQSFFQTYVDKDNNANTYYSQCLNKHNELVALQQEQLRRMPFSNTWIAGQMASCIPDNSTVALSILNTLRTWNYFSFKNNVNVYSPTGGFGIDAAMSTLIGASLTDTKKNYYLVIGDLAFFYELNALGNRHIGNNLRILLVNNGCGVEFKRSYGMTFNLLKEDVDAYVAAKNHFACKSSTLVRHFAEDLGFDYISASGKEEFEGVYKTFLEEKRNRPLLFECFVEDQDDVESLNIIHNRN